jgi:hypothetical protein
MSKYFCPLKKMTVKTDAGTTKEFFLGCVEESCAWYVKETDECALKCLASQIENIIAITEGANVGGSDAPLERQRKA